MNLRNSKCWSCGAPLQSLLHSQRRNRQRQQQRINQDVAPGSTKPSVHSTPFLWPSAGGTCQSTTSHPTPTDMRTYRHTGLQTYKHTDVQTYRHTGTQTYRHTDIRTDGHRGHSDTHTHTETYTHTDTRTYGHRDIRTYIRTFRDQSIQTYTNIQT